MSEDCRCRVIYVTDYSNTKKLIRRELTCDLCLEADLRRVAQEQRDRDIAIVKKLIIPDEQLDALNAASNGTCKALLFVLQDTALVTDPEPE